MILARFTSSWKKIGLKHENRIFEHGTIKKRNKKIEKILFQIIFDYKMLKRNVSFFLLVNVLRLSKIVPFKVEYKWYSKV